MVASFARYDAKHQYCFVTTLYTPAGDSSSPLLDFRLEENAMLTAKPAVTC
jgi:hypothetical protein